MYVVNSIKRFTKRAIDALFRRFGYERKSNLSRTWLDRLYSHDASMMREHMGSLHPDKINAMLADLILHAHGVEKGLTMHDFRAGFGRDKIQHLCDILILYHNKKFDTKEFGFVFAARVLKEYIAIHERLGFLFSEEEQLKMERAAKLCPQAQTLQYQTTDDEYYAHKDSDFARFSASRHSIRQFNGPVPIDTIIEAVKLSQNAPSACNRQYSKVHLVNGKDNVNAILSLQGGNSALMNAADQVLILTADMQALMWEEERRDLWHNAGIFSMNLSYSLHYYKIAHCMCAWSVGPDADCQIHNRFNIPNNEAVTVLMLIGKAPHTFKYATSPRKGWKDVLVVHDI